MKKRKEEEEKEEERETGHVNKTLEGDEAASKESSDDITRPRRPAMKKVDSVMEATSLGHMTAHSNIYPLRNRQEDRDDADAKAADSDMVVVESGMRTLDATMTSYSSGDLEEHNRPDVYHPGISGNRPIFEMGMPKNDSIEEEEEEEKEADDSGK